MIHVSPRHKAVCVPFSAAIASLLPTAKTITVEGNPFAVLQHDTDTTNLLRQLGHSVPAPIAAQYDWDGGTPYKVQIETASLLTLNRRAYVLNGMGTGKTKSSLWAWRWLNRTKQAGKLLVVAPLSTLAFTWGREIFQTLPGVKSVVIHGTREQRMRKLDDRTVDVYIVNHDGLKIIETELSKREDIDTVVIDELAVYRNGGSARTKVAKRVAERMKWAWGMTGGPVPNGPEDAWGQATVINPNRAPKYFGRWRDEVMIRLSQFRYAPKKDALDKVHDLLQPAVRFSLDDVVELPDLIERQVDVPLGPNQAKVYATMEKEAHAAIAEQKITAMNAGAVLSKLLQISTGWVYTREGEVVALDGESRLQAAVDLVESCENKVLVFAPFKHALSGIVKRFTDEGIECVEVSGDTPATERGRIFAAFQNTSKYKVLVAHPQCLAHGITLTAADTIIWYAPIADLEIFDQANARIRRIGQKKKQQIIMFQATKAEKHLYSKLRQKQKVQGALLDMFQDSTEQNTSQNYAA